MLGEEEGAELGADDGDEDGAELGEEEGADEGAVLGEEEGAELGDAVGLVQPSTFVALHVVSPSSGP